MIRRLIPLSALALLVVGCQSAPQVEMGNATPQPSPSTAQVDGELLDVGVVTDIALEGDTLAVRSGDRLLVGNVDEFRSGTVKTIDARGCSDLTGGTIALTCGTTIKTLTGDIKLDHPANTAVIASDGSVIAADKEENTIRVYRDGEQVEKFSVDAPTDELLLLDNDTVLRINRADSTIQDVRWKEGRQGGTLRVGLGVGTMSAGPGAVAAVSDTLGNQLAIYTSDDVVRLHQTTPTEESPYAVAFDGSHAWVVSTATNTITSYDISGGVPIAQERHATVANARSVAIIDESVVVGGSDGLHVFSKED